MVMFPPQHDEPGNGDGPVSATEPTVSSLTPQSRRGRWLSPTPDSLLGIGGEHDLTRDSIKARLFPTLGARVDALPAKIARFSVLRRLGEGGMGVVFVAYDDQLDRKIAIKLLRGHHRSDEHSRSRVRLKREAQALARLSHPNVVGVHEVGEWRGEDYIAMELVPGQTLRKWLSRPRPWSDIVAVLVQAGRGLHAAHEAGLVHRDFKPDNVMVDDDGRVRVLDFGLVRASESGESELSESEFEPDMQPLDQPLTRAGSVMGTPVYMAPEQHEGKPVDALSDQFSFCVTAFEALFGQRPFASASLYELIEATRVGAVREIPRDSKVPRRVRETVLRGLEADPARRWPSMAALLAELEAVADRHSRRPWTLLAAGSAGAIVAGVLVGSWPTPELDPESRCAGIDASALAGSWDDVRRAEIEQAMLATGAPYAASSFAVFAAELDAWSGEWVAAEREACEATHVSEVQSSALLERRQVCLANQARRVEGLLAAFTNADSSVLDRTGELLAQLPDPTRCTDPDRQPVELEPALAEQVAAIEVELGKVEGLLAVGRLERAGELLDGLAGSPVRASQPAIDVRISGFGLELEWARGHQPEVADRWRALAGEARLHGLAELETDLRVELAIAAVGSLPKLELERWLIDDAELALAASDERDSRRVFRLARARLQLLARQGHYEQAKLGYLALITEIEPHGWRDLSAFFRLALAGVEAELGDLDAAERDYQAGRSLLAEQWGPAHPLVAAADHDLAIVAIDRGDFDRARTLLDQAEAIHRINPGSLALADDRSARAGLALSTGNLAEAGEVARAALEVYERELGPNHETTLRMIEIRGIVRYFEGDLDGSLADYDRVLPEYVARFGEHDVQVGLLHVNRGDTLLALGRASEALAEHQRGFDTLMAAVPGHPVIGSARAGRGEARLALGEHALAIEDLELAVTEIEPGEVTELAETRFALARALAAAGRDPDRVAELGDQARSSFEQLGLTTLVETLDRWRRH